MKPPPPPPKPHFWNGQRVAGAIVSVVGLAGVGVGTYFGLDTFSKKSQRDQHCNGTVCDAAAEECPVWLGQGRRVHHSFPDPARASGAEAEIMQEFRTVRNAIAHDIGQLLETFV